MNLYDGKPQEDFDTKEKSPARNICDGKTQKGFRRQNKSQTRAELVRKKNRRTKTPFFIEREAYKPTHSPTCAQERTKREAKPTPHYLSQENEANFDPTSRKERRTKTVPDTIMVKKKQPAPDTDDQLFMEETDEDREMPYKSEREFKCPKFNTGEGTGIRQWLRFYEKRCEKMNFDEERKLSFLPDALGSEALTYYISQCMDINNWEELKQMLTDRFETGPRFTFDDLIQTNYSMFPTIQQYFNRKIDIAFELQLKDDTIIQSLNSGLPEQYKNVLASHAIITTSQWIQIARRVCTRPGNQQTDATLNPRPSESRPHLLRRPDIEPRRHRNFHGPPMHSNNTGYNART